MSSVSFLSVLGYLEVGLCVAALLVLVARKQWNDYFWLACFLAFRISSNAALTLLHSAAGHFLSVSRAYDCYFYVYWFGFAAESVLSLLVVYGVFRLAMAPLKGLQTLGMLIFKWAAGISVVVALGSAARPDMNGTQYLMAAISQLQRTQSVLALCLLVFVTFAIRPMGLSYASRIFGVGLGLGIMSTNDLVQAAWLLRYHSMASSYSLVNGVVICVILATWTAYFVIPEPKRRMIVLPTTSPFLRWNQISQALGDAPGFVAVGGIPPELFAPAELEVMRRASAKMPSPFPAAANRLHLAPSSERLTSSRAI